jgi:hypothetical protein
MKSFENRKLEVSESNLFAGRNTYVFMYVNVYTHMYVYAKMHTFIPSLSTTNNGSSLGYAVIHLLFHFVNSGGVNEGSEVDPLLETLPNPVLCMGVCV